MQVCLSALHSEQKIEIVFDVFFFFKEIPQTPSTHYCTFHLI